MGRQPPASSRGPTGRSPSETPVVGKTGYLAARRTGRLRGSGRPMWPVAARRPGTPPPSHQRAAFRPSPSPEPEAEEAASRTEQRCLNSDGCRKRKKALYLVLQEQGGHGAESGCHYAVHRVDLARSRSRHGISVAGEELGEPAVTRFKAAPGLGFLKLGSNKIVGVTDKDALVVEPESVVIDAGTWHVYPGLPPASATCGLVAVSGKIYAVDMLNEGHPRCEVLRSARDASAAGRWSPLPRPPFSDRVVSLAAYPPRRGLLVSTAKHGTYLLDGRRRGGAAWVALPGLAARLLPVGDRAVYAKDHDLWFEVSPRDGRLRAHDLDVVVRGAEAELTHEAHRVSDPIPVVVAPGVTVSGARLVYLGSGKFCVVRVTDGAVTVTVFKMVDSEMPVALAERRRRRRERAINAEWVTDELERACADKASQSCPRRRKLCRAG